MSDETEQISQDAQNRLLKQVQKMADVKIKTETIGVQTSVTQVGSNETPPISPLQSINNPQDFNGYSWIAAVLDANMDGKWDVCIGDILQGAVTTAADGIDKLALYAGLASLGTMRLVVGSDSDPYDGDFLGFYFDDTLTVELNTTGNVSLDLWDVASSNNHFSIQTNVGTAGCPVLTITGNGKGSILADIGVLPSGIQLTFQEIDFGGTVGKKWGLFATGT